MCFFYKAEGRILGNLLGKGLMKEIAFGLGLEEYIKFCR